MRNWRCNVRLEAAGGFEIRAPRRLAPPRYTRSLECNYAFGFDVVARVMTAPRRLIGETSLRARTHAQRMDALSERGWFEAG